MAEAKNIIITGASRGFGAHLARRFADQACRLLLVARSAPELETLGEALGPGVAVLVADVSDPRSPDRIRDAAHELWPRADVLINNAAIQGPIGPAWENDPGAWERTIAVNLLAPVSLCHAILPWMIDAGGGRIINLSGGGGTSPRPRFSAYASAKAGLVRYSETLAEELREFRVSVNCVAPGAMASDMLKSIVDAGLEASGEDEHGRAGQVLSDAGDVPVAALDLVEYLATEAPDSLTGKLISAPWDPWRDFAAHEEDLSSDIYTLRRIVPADRGKSWGEA